MSMNRVNWEGQVVQAGRAGLGFLTGSTGDSSIDPEFRAFAGPS